MDSKSVFDQTRLRYPESAPKKFLCRSICGTSKVDPHMLSANPFVALKRTFKTCSSKTVCGTPKMDSKKKSRTQFVVSIEQKDIGYCQNFWTKLFVVAKAPQKHSVCTQLDPQNGLRKHYVVTDPQNVSAEEITT